MNIAEYKYKITLEEPVYSSNDYSDKQIVEYTGRSIAMWARKIDIGGNKTIQNYELFHSQSLQFEIRYRSDVDETWRVKFNNKYYQITAPFKSTEYKRNIVITCELLQ